MKLNHIAIIPDGNRRWAKKRRLPTFEGHRRGFERVSELGKKARELGIRIFTIWAFSTENWKRSEKEVFYLMKLYETMIDKNINDAIKDGVRIIHLGRKDRLSRTLRKKIEEAEEKTKHLKKYYFAIALDYGGRDEILRAIAKIRNSNIEIRNEGSFNQFLDTTILPQPEPDFIIRTSGEMRTSGFLLWQSAYTEYIFVDKYFPDFTPVDLEKCIKEYVNRQRRFGK